MNGRTTETDFESPFVVAFIAEHAWGATRLFMLGRTIPAREWDALKSAFVMVASCENIEELLDSAAAQSLNGVSTNDLAAHHWLTSALKSRCTGNVYEIRKPLEFDSTLLHRLRRTLRRLIDYVDARAATTGTISSEKRKPPTKDLGDLETALAMLHVDSVKRLTTTTVHAPRPQYWRTARQLHP